MAKKLTIRQETPVKCTYDEMVPLSKLKAHPKNRNKHPESQIERLAQILKYQGFRMPVRVSKASGYVTGGHGRIEAARLNGWDRVPVNFQEYESEEQEYADLVADNAIALWAELDLKGIGEDVLPYGPDFDLDLLGLEDFVLDVSETYDTDPDAVPEVPKEAKTKRGELWTLGNHRVLCGDATDKADVERLMAGEKADMVFTDPPYGVSYTDSLGRSIKNDELTGHKLLEFLSDAFTAAKEVTDDNAAWFVWHASRYQREFEAALESCGVKVRQQVIWVKGEGEEGTSRVAAPAIGRSDFRWLHEPCFYATAGKPFNKGDRTTTTVWTVTRPTRGTDHPTQKPTGLIEIALDNSCPGGGLVLDSFLGSGSTLLACEKTGRRCRGTELDTAYMDVILDRWAKFTGKDPVREDGKRWSELKGE